MRKHHVRLLLLALGSATFAGGAIAGCGGGGSSNNGSGDDGGSQSDTSTGGGDDASSGTDGGQGEASSGPQANANDVSVYLGQIARLDGSQSTPPDATFAWTVLSAPAGSAVNTGSLLNANGAKPSFTPDVLGDYALKLVVTSNGASSTKNLTVHAVTAHTFYVEYLAQYDDGGGIDGGPLAHYSVVPTVGADGGGSQVTCDFQGQGSLPPALVIYSGGLSSVDQWEGPPGTDARALLLGWESLSDGGVASHLLAATSSMSCGGTAPKVLDTVMNGSYAGGGSEVNAPAMPSFSPDGNRVLYVKSLAAVSATITTIGFDGTGANSVGPFNVYPDGGAQNDAGVVYVGKPPPRWAPGGKIALASNLPNSRFQVVLMDDANNATPTLVMGCSGSLVHYDTLPNGDYLVEGNLLLPDSGTSTNIFVLHPNALTKECEIVRNLSNLPPSSTFFGMTLSPDKTRVAYTAKDSSIDAGSGKDNVLVYVAAIDGTTPASPVPSLPYGSGGTGGLYYRPPRWVAGGSALTFEMANNVAYDGGSTSRAAIAVAPASGGSFNVLAGSPTNNNHLITSVTTCSIGYGPGSGIVAFVALGAFVGLAARRRRRGTK